MQKLTWKASVAVIFMIAVLPVSAFRPKVYLKMIGEKMLEKIYPSPEPQTENFNYIDNYPSTHGSNLLDTIKDSVRTFLDQNINYLRSDTYGINFLSGKTRKNHPNSNKPAIVIVVPQKHTEDKLIPPGYTQFKPSKELIQLMEKRKPWVKNRDLQQREDSDNDDSDDSSVEVRKSKKKRVDDILSRLNLQRRSLLRPGELLLGKPTRPEHLPEALPIHPGHTLLRPTRGMLKSAIKYPLRDFGGSAVYGNLDNLGITAGKTRNRIRYTDFRKTNKNDLTYFQTSNDDGYFENGKRFKPWIVFELDPSDVQALANQVPVKENEASEILDVSEELFDADSNEPLDFRRHVKKNKSKFRDRTKFYARAKSSSEEGTRSKISSSSSEESLEKNEGNPFTIFKNKYKQNWMWNHKFDGIHMNVNPYAPQFNQLGPAGAQLFYGRKWWYYNQDDFKPMGRKR